MYTIEFVPMHELISSTPVLVHRCYTIEEAQEKEQRLIGFEKPSWNKRLLHKKRPRLEKVIALLTEL